MKLSQTSKFKKDIQKQIKRGKNPEKLSKVVEWLLTGEPLPSRFRDHALTGNWKDRRDCHIEPDWILIYRLTQEELRLERTGSHSDLF